MGLKFSKQPAPQFLEIDLDETIAISYSLRCDAKQGEKRFIDFEKYLNGIPHFLLSEVLPRPMIKGVQPNYIEDIDIEGVPVINTLSIQSQKINKADCRLISDEDFEFLDDDRKCQKGDVLLTLDGGTSIGKPVLFDLEGNFTIDSHVGILRPVGIKPIVLVYLLASPIGQLQFQKAESGASGQTSVTEDDIRRFKFPKNDIMEKEVEKIDQTRREFEEQTQKLQDQLSEAWINFSNVLLANK